MDIIFFAALAFYIFFKLSKHLGRIDEEEKQQIEARLEQMKIIQQQILNQAKQQEKIVGTSSTEVKNQNDDNAFLNLDETSKQNLITILQQSNITAEFFLQGAKSAFEIIIKSFASGDLQSLKLLLSDKIFSGFELAINKRKAEEKILTTNLISIAKAEIISALILENIASVVIKFVSKQINYLSGKDGKILDGKKDEIVEVADIWTFKRDLTSSNPNWMVSTTNSN